MTEHRPPACRYDRGLGECVTRGHRDDCTTPDQHRGCLPCTAPHCVVCGHEHLTNDQPQTCPTCLGKVREDLDTIPPAFTALVRCPLCVGSAAGTPTECRGRDLRVACRQKWDRRWTGA